MNAYLSLLSLFLPVQRRDTWLSEWNAELWHVRSECGWVAALHLLRGALADARELRALAQKDVSADRAAVRPWKQSWIQPLALPLASLLIMACAAMCVPGARDVLLSQSYNAPSSIVLLKDAEQPTIAYATYSEWTRRPQLLFDEFAFYAVQKRYVNGERLRVATASSNLLRMLGLGGPAGDGMYLSYAAAKQLGYPSQVRLGASMVRVRGVLPRTTLKLWDDPEVIVLADRLPAGMHGHVLGAVAQGAPNINWGFVVTYSKQPPLHIHVTPLEERVFMPGRAFLFACVILLFALPGTRPLSREDGPRMPMRLRWRPTIFVGVQVLLLLAAAYLGSLAIAMSMALARPEDVGGPQAFAAFVLLLPTIRLTLRSNRHRCPCCLRKLGHPARVGQPSAAFLNWYGTELLCAQGHGMMHIPDMPTTWFSEPRWMPLDSSWAVLFSQ
ncbi:hypothetical protein FTW19_14225 [Terriglobus albidus]|uniref:MacB-like periplasmic core domain-containing protein n=1 Tax=Terriglobus albidus TaxID=1592106 RepID=A0A5B9EBH4_9BACT|nr:hypothetical protein [Terriglobus albidus]QEE29054.1 hypothetical protein FTW19_14225 [Terriglobus albidus]